MNASFSPKFVPARVSFRLADKQYPIGQQLINVAGTPAFAWTQFDPFKSIGTKVKATVEVLGSAPWKFTCNATLTCEQTSASTLLGLNFEMPEFDKSKLEATINREGTYPDYVRKFPRLHYMPQVSVFPSRAIIRFFYGKEDIAVSCDVENLSPQGIQVFTEDDRTAVLLPDTTARVVIQPRGSFLRPIPFNGLIKRAVLTVDPVTGNMRRYLGLSIATISSDAKLAYADLLKKIVLQARGGSSKAA